MPKFVYFGTPDVARDTLALLLERGLTPSLVVSSPDRPQGRGLVLTPSETSAFAREHGIPCITPEVLDADCIRRIAQEHADIGIVVAYGKILPQELIDVFPHGMLNVHYSLLPKYRGASPVESALLQGEEKTGVTVQKLVRKMDAGDILGTSVVTITDTETTKELRARLIPLGAELLMNVLPGYMDGTLIPTPQDESLVSRAGKFKKEDGCLDLDGDPLTNWRKYRAFFVSPGTHFFHEKDGKPMRVKIVSASYRNGAFVPLKVVPEGKSEMDYAEAIARF
jgi:methionyl-tRNA formyltransferase